MEHEKETFLDLLTSLPHWELELVIILIVDVIVGMIIWPRIKRWGIHHRGDDLKIENLQKELKEIRSSLKALETKSCSHCSEQHI